MDILTIPAAQQTIQSILSPALMISACGLLLLGLNNRYSTVVGRLRLLNDETRRRLAIPETNDRDVVDAIRFESLTRQIPSLHRRANHLRHALISLWISVLCSLVSSLSLGLSLFFHLPIAVASVSIFMIGIAAAAVGVVYAMFDISLAHKVLNLEAEIF